MNKLKETVFATREAADVFIDRQLARKRRCALLATAERITVYSAS